MKKVIKRLKEWYRLKLEGVPPPKYLSGTQSQKVLHD